MGSFGKNTLFKDYAFEKQKQILAGAAAQQRGPTMNIQ
jgi:hypothetical protein